MTIDELREFCLRLPETHEKETWGDADHPGDVTFRVRERIYLITGPDGGRASLRTSIEQQSDLLSAFPSAVAIAPYTGRFGWVSVDLEAMPQDVLRDLVVAVWRRTAPKAVVAAWEGIG